MLDKELGQGSFGKVMLASFKESPRFQVAVKFIKTTRGTVSDECFKKETDLMKGLYDENVISLIGLVFLRLLRVL